jgi:hypothetical protein
MHTTVPVGGEIQSPLFGGNLIGDVRVCRSRVVLMHALYALDPGLCWKILNGRVCFTFTTVSMHMHTHYLFGLYELIVPVLCTSAY